MRILELQALGTQWWIEPLDRDFSSETCRGVMDYIAAFEQAYSRFRPDSLLSRLNDAKQLTNPPSEMVDMVRFGIDMYERTGGLFNLSVGSKLEQLGYGRASDPAARISDNLPQDVIISVEHIRLAPHVRLDFGGFGKGWLVDAVGVWLIAHGHDYFIVNGGGDIMVRSDKPQEISIEHPYDKTLGVGAVQVVRGSVAASSAVKRRWTQADGDDANHIINPFHGKLTGRDAAPNTPLGGAPSVVSISVYAAPDTLTLYSHQTTLMADTLGTVMLLADGAQRDKLAQDFGVTYLVIDTQLQFYTSPGFPGAMNT